jgi:uncharacterized protein YjbI with pentapeptide repeats
MGGRLRRCATIGAVALLAAPGGQASAEPSPVRAATIEARLRDGQTVVHFGATVEGELDLRAQVVQGAFKCRQCTFEDRIRATDATFARTLDLTGSILMREVDFGGATFRGPALFRIASPSTEPVFERGVDFSLAVFENIASFNGAIFNGLAEFQDARFAGANFSGADFVEAARFTNSEFRERVDFGGAWFEKGAIFSEAQFGQDASFLAAKFWAPNKKPGADEQEAADFDGVVSTGGLDFTFAEFSFQSPRQPIPAGTEPVSRQIATFDDIVCGRSLVLRENEFADDTRFVASVSLTRAQVADLVLDVDETDRIGVEADRQEILAAIEDSAKTRGDLSVANDAHFRLLKLRSQEYWPLTRALDFVFYRNIAGYFVQPFRPLLILVGLAAVFSVVRYVRQRRRAADESDPPEQVSEGSSFTKRVRGAQQESAAFSTCVFDTFALIVPRWGGRAEPLALGERFQVIIYRLLLVCALIGLANSNPTLRNMFDTLV